MCKGTTEAAFPTLSIELDDGGGRFELEGPDYVDCYRDSGHCYPCIRRNVLGDFVIFGDYFLRKYYTVFDRGHRRVSSVCAVGAPKSCK